MLLNRNIILGFFAVLSTYAQAKPEDNVLKVPEQISSILRKQAMPELGSEHLEKILTRYYKEGLGGLEHWEKISSLRVTGNLKLKDGTFRLDAYQKKPNLIKMAVSYKNRTMVLAYDGDVAWQIKPIAKAKPEPMTEAEARRFKHSAWFGSHLLYPYAEGKKISYIDTVPLEGDICHQIRVDLENGYQVDYFINIHSYLEVKVLNRDLKTGLTSHIVYKDYNRDYLMPIAQKVENYENGEWVSSLSIDEIK